MVVVCDHSCFNLGVVRTSLLELVKGLEYSLPVVFSEADDLLYVHVRRPNPIGGRKLICGRNVIAAAVEVVTAFNLKKRSVETNEE